MTIQTTTKLSTSGYLYFILNPKYGSGVTGYYLLEAEALSEKIFRHRTRDIAQYRK